MSTVLLEKCNEYTKGRIMDFKFFNCASREVNTSINIFVTLKLYLPTSLKQFNFHKINLINLNMSVFDTSQMCFTVDKV
jgi:hypothetical protein